MIFHLPFHCSKNSLWRRLSCTDFACEKVLVVGIDSTKVDVVAALRNPSVIRRFVCCCSSRDLSTSYELLLRLSLGMCFRIMVVVSKNRRKKFRNCCRRLIFDIAVVAFVGKIDKFGSSFDVIDRSLSSLSSFTLNDIIVR